MADVFVHPQGLCESDEVGAGTRVWAFAHVMRGARVGTGCNVCDHAFVESGAVVGDRVTVKNGVMIWDGVVIEDDVFVGPGATFTNVTNPRVGFKRGGEGADAFEATVVCRGVTIGANSTIVCGTTIGEYAFVGAGAVVTRDVPAHTLVVGNPARPAGWVCVCARRLGPDLVCGSCGSTYKLTAQGLSPTQPA